MTKISDLFDVVAQNCDDPSKRDDYFNVLRVLLKFRKELGIANDVDDLRANVENIIDDLAEKVGNKKETVYNDIGDIFQFVDDDDNYVKCDNSDNVDDMYSEIDEDENENEDEGESENTQDVNVNNAGSMLLHSVLNQARYNSFLLLLMLSMTVTLVVKTFSG